MMLHHVQSVEESDTTGDATSTNAGYITFLIMRNKYRRINCFYDEIGVAWMNDV
jgi:hypothetical protein